MSKKYPNIIEPSIFAADFANLGEEAKRAEQAGADAIHFDIMDGHFVPNLSLSPTALAAVNRTTDIFLDVHIMVYNPFSYIERLVEMGADAITFHFESTEEIGETLDYIRKCGVKAGLAFCPETSESMIPKYLNKCDHILLMTVHPGFGGQKFIPDVLEKIKFTRGICDKLRIRKGGVSLEENQDIDSLPPFDIQVDGGINEKTAKLCVDAGANVLIAGTYLFASDQMPEKIQKLRDL